MDINKIISLPKRAKVVLILLASTVIFMMGYFLNIKFKIAEYERINQQKTFLITELSEKQMQMNKLKAEANQLRQMQIKDESILNLLSSSMELSQLLAELLRASQQTQVVVQKIEPGAVISEEKYRVQPVHLLLLGDYFQLQAYLDQIIKLPAIIGIEKFSINISSEDNQFLIFDVMIDFYKKA